MVLTDHLYDENTNRITSKLKATRVPRVHPLRHTRDEGAAGDVAGCRHGPAILSDMFADLRTSSARAPIQLG